MRVRRRRLWASIAVACALAIAACGSQSTRTVTVTSRETVTQSATVSTTATAGRHGSLGGAVIHGQLPGVTGQAGTPTDLSGFTRRPPLGPAAHIAGVQGLSLPQEQGAMLQNVAQFWQNWFGNQHVQLPAGGYALVSSSPDSCGSSQITASSAPLYCPTNAIIYLPQTTIASRVKPLGDSALLYVLAYLYSQHVADAVGVTAAKYGQARLAPIYSCFAGVYFYEAEGEGILQPTDEAGVNRLLSALAPTGSKTTATELTTAFNRGILSDYHPGQCLK